MDTRSDREISECFAQWRRDFAARMETQRARVLATLTAGLPVVEHIGDKPKAWIVGNTGTFIEPYNSDPVYLTDHLMNRHRGFGFDHTIEGVRYHLGAIRDAA